MSRRVSLNLHTPPRKGASIDDLCKIFEFMTPLSPSDADIISGRSQSEMRVGRYMLILPCYLLRPQRIMEAAALLLTGGGENKSMFG